MATDGKALRWNGVAYSAQDERRLNAVSMMPGSSAEPFSARAGRRVNGTGLAVTADSTGNGSTSVSAGVGVIYDSAYSTQGAYPFEIPQSVGPIALGARPSSGQSRIDLVVARIYDADASLGAVREVKIEVVAGTAGPSPVSPSTPPMSLVLASLTVPNSGTITVSPSSWRTVAAGGILPVSTNSERTHAEVTAAYPGLTVFNAETGRLETWDGTLWDYPGRWISYTPTLSNATGAAAGIYTRIGGKVTVEFKINFSGAASGNVIISKPITGALTAVDYALGSAMGYDANVGSTSRRGMTVLNRDADNVYFLVDSLASAATVDTAVPWTWASGDTIAGMFEYRI